MKKVFRILLINLSILLVLLIVVEIILRILNIGYGNEPLENDRTLHHKHPSDYNFISYTPTKEYGGHYVIYDSIGNRIPDNYKPEPFKKPIWFIGDSFTAAIQVSWHNSYVGQLEYLLKNRYQGINFGVSSYSPLLYVIQLKKYLNIFPRPKVVFIQLYSNDISDDEKYQKLSRFNQHDEPVFCDGGKSNLITGLLRKLYIARTIRKIQLVIEYRSKKKGQSNNKSELKTEHFIEEAPIINSQQRFAKSVLQINHILDSLNIPHYFFSIPSKYSVVTKNWNVATFSKNFSKFAEDNQIPIIYLDDAFKVAANNQKLFYDVDIHCNENGNKLIAAELFKKIQAIIP